MTSPAATAADDDDADAAQNSFDRDLSVSHARSVVKPVFEYVGGMVRDARLRRLAVDTVARLVTNKSADSRLIRRLNDTFSCRGNSCHVDCDICKVYFTFTHFSFAFAIINV